MEYQDTLRKIRSILVIDWPTKEVPERLAAAGFDVTVRGGPGPLDYAAYTAEAGSVSRRPCACPEQIDLIYAHRPLGELSSILAIAKEVASGASDPMAISLEPFERQFLDFADAIAKGRKPLVSGEEGVQAMEIVDAIYRSCRTGEKVTL